MVVKGRSVVEVPVLLCELWKFLSPRLCNISVTFVELDRLCTFIGPMFASFLDESLLRWFGLKKVTGRSIKLDFSLSSSNSIFVCLLSDEPTIIIDCAFVRLDLYDFLLDGVLLTEPDEISSYRIICYFVRLSLNYPLSIFSISCVRWLSYRMGLIWFILTDI